MQIKNFLKKIPNQIKPTWKNNKLFKLEHPMFRFTKNEKIYDHILYITKGNITNNNNNSINILNWDEKELSDHFLIYTTIEIGGNSITIGSFNMQNLFGLKKNIYNNDDLTKYFNSALSKNIDIIGIQELDNSNVNIISNIIKDLSYDISYDTCNNSLTAIIYNPENIKLNKISSIKRNNDKSKGATYAEFTFNEISFNFISVHLLSKNCEYRDYPITNMGNILINNKKKICNTSVRKKELQKYICNSNPNFIDTIIVGDFNTGKIDSIIQGIECVTNGGRIIYNKKTKKIKQNNKIKKYKINKKYKTKKVKKSKKNKKTKKIFK